LGVIKSEKAGGMERRILILTGNHLCNNPRVLKEAQLLAEAGAEVVVLGGWTDPVLAERDRRLLLGKPWRYVPVVDWTREDFSGRLARFWGRVRRRLGVCLYRWFGIPSGWQLGYAGPELLESGRRMGAVLVIAHSEQSLWAARKLAGPAGKRVVVGVDFEDWFSEDLSLDARRERPVGMLWRLEHWAMEHAVYCTCPSEAMAEAMARKAGGRRPSVVYNAFPWGDRSRIGEKFQDRVDFSRVSVHWFSQTLGPGRGLEDLFEAIPLVEHDMEVHLRGVESPGARDWIAQRVPKNSRVQVFVHAAVEPGELLDRISEHDIGLASECREPASRDLTVTNKILHYLLGGLAVVASDTSGQKEVAEKAAGAVRLYRAGDPHSLAAVLNELASSIEDLEEVRKASVRAAHAFFCWERVSQVLLDQVAKALNEARIRRGEPAPGLPAADAKSGHEHGAAYDLETSMEVSVEVSDPVESAGVGNQTGSKPEVKVVEAAFEEMLEAELKSSSPPGDSGFGDVEDEKAPAEEEPVAGELPGWGARVWRRMVYPGLNLHVRMCGGLSRYWKRGRRRVLDASGGGGYFGWISQRTGAEVISMRYSVRDLEVERCFYGGTLGISEKRMRFERLSAEGLEEEGRVFDEVICFFGLERCVRDREVMEGFYRVLKPGGLLHVCVANRAHPRHREENDSGLWPLGSERCRPGYLEPELRRLVSAAGFNLEFLEGVGSPWVDRWAGAVAWTGRWFGGLAAWGTLFVARGMAAWSGRNPLRPYAYYAKAAKPAIRG
jgi:glycosyltransferase involved in cell wall biosynthesis/SAM-dependent methyltransferase